LICYRDFHLTLAVLLAKSENPKYLCFKNNSFSHNFFHSALSVAVKQPDLNPVDYAVWGILQERVYKYHGITDVVVEAEWDRLDQEVIDSVISERRKRLTACVAAGKGHFEN